MSGKIEVGCLAVIVGSSPPCLDNVGKVVKVVNHYADAPNGAAWNIDSEKEYGLIAVPFGCRYPIRTRTAWSRECYLMRIDGGEEIGGYTTQKETEEACQEMQA